MSKMESEYAALLTPLLAKRDSLSRKRDSLSQELEQVESAISALKAASEAGSSPVVMSQEPARPNIEQSKQSTLASREVFTISTKKNDDLLDGMTQPEMASAVLRHVGKPLLSREILDIWVEHGRKPVGVDGNQKVQVALKRREKSHQDVIHVGDGKWGLREWYSPDEIEKFLKTTTSYAFDKRVHKKRMVDGIKRAKDNGALWGRRPSLRESQWNLAIRLVADGGYKWTEIYRRLIEINEPDQEKFSYQLVLKYRDQFLKAEPYPDNWRKYFERLAESSASTNQPPAMRLVE